MKKYLLIYLLPLLNLAYATGDFSITNSTLASLGIIGILLIGLGIFFLFFLLYGSNILLNQHFKKLKTDNTTNPIIQEIRPNNIVSIIILVIFFSLLSWGMIFLFGIFTYIIFMIFSVIILYLRIKYLKKMRDQP